MGVIEHLVRAQLGAAVALMRRPGQLLEDDSHGGEVLLVARVDLDAFGSRAGEAVAMHRQKEVCLGVVGHADARLVAGIGVAVACEQNGVPLPLEQRLDSPCHAQVIILFVAAGRAGQITVCAAVVTAVTGVEHNDPFHETTS